MENNSTNPVIIEDEYAIYEAWYELDNSTGYYVVPFRIYAKPGVTIQVAYAELFNNTSQHPTWVGGNPWAWTTPYRYPDYAGAEWMPVKPDEMPVTIVFSLVAEKG
jgi:hypothetical protein